MYSKFYYYLTSSSSTFLERHNHIIDKGSVLKKANKKLSDLYINSVSVRYMDKFFFTNSPFFESTFSYIKGDVPSTFFSNKFYYLSVFTNNFIPKFSTMMGFSNRFFNFSIFSLPYSPSFYSSNFFSFRNSTKLSFSIVSSNEALKANFSFLGPFSVLLERLIQQLPSSPFFKEKLFYFLSTKLSLILPSKKGYFSSSFLSFYKKPDFSSSSSIFFSPVKYAFKATSFPFGIRLKNTLLENFFFDINKRINYERKLVLKYYKRISKKLQRKKGRFSL